MQSLRLRAFLGAALAAGMVLAAGPLGALPALLAFVVLLAGHYPGATQLDRLIVAARRRSTTPARPASRRAPRRPIRVRVRRGGALIASSLAKRPPPALLSQV